MLNTQKIQSMLEEFRGLSAQAQVQVPSISRWGVGMHVQHCLIAMVAFLEGLLQSSPPMPVRQFSLRKLIVFMTGKIPRGRAKAPKISRPDPDVCLDELKELHEKIDLLLKEVRLLDKDAWCAHPYFGPLGRDEVLKFIVIHNNHHLGIIRDIVAAV